MKKLKLGIIYSILILCLGLFTSLSVNATSGSGDSGDTQTGSQSLLEGASTGKTGYLIYTCTESGSPTSKVVFVTTSKNPIFTTTGVLVDTSGLVTKFGYKFNDAKTGIIWGYGPFSKSGGNGKAIKQWLLAPYKDGMTGCAWVCKNYLGFSDDKYAEWMSNENSYLVVEAVVWCGNYSGKSFLGNVFVGTTSGWKTKDDNSWVKKYTHGNLPNGMYMDKAWLGLGVPSNVSSVHSNGDMGSSLGYGMVAVRPNGIDLIEVFKTQGTVDDTSYGSCNLPYEIKHQGDYKAKKYYLSDKTTTVRGIHDFNDFGLPHIADGSAPCTVPKNPKAKTLVVLYEREKVTTTRAHDEDALLAWENSYVMPNYKAKRADGHTVNNCHIVYDDIENYVNETIAGIQYAVLDDFEYDEEYKVRADLGSFPYSVWNLYRSSAQIGLWDTFSPAIGSTWWSVYDVIDPKFSYYLTRSHLERLSTSPDREGYRDFLVMITPNNPFSPSFLPAGLIEQAGNTEILRPETVGYGYTYSTSPIWIKIYYHLEIPHHDLIEEDEDEDSAESSESESETKEPKYNDWTEIVEKDPLERRPSFEIASGNTGTHKFYKYRVGGTPTASSTAGGSILAAQNGTELSGRFMKGDSFTYTPIEHQTIASSFHTVFKIYPEVLMTVWKSQDTKNYVEPKEHPVYVMGEIVRKFVPSIVHGYKTGIHNSFGGGVKAIGSLASATTGTNASKLPNSSLGTTAMGTTFEVASYQSYYEMDLMTVGMTISDSEAHGPWENDRDLADVVASHESYVSSVLAGLDQEIIMELEYHDGSNNKFYYTLLTDSNDNNVSPTSTEYVDIFFHDGGYDQVGTVQSYCSNLYGENAYSDGLQIEQILDTMFISNNGDGEDNKSTGYIDTGNGIDLDRTHWYDEESKEKIRVVYCKTHVKFSTVSSDDKVDYNLLTQSVKSRDLKQNDYIRANFYLRLFKNLKEVDDTNIKCDGYEWEHNGIYRVDKLVGCDFNIANQTNSQMKK